MGAFLHIFLTEVLPAFLVMAVGVLLDRKLHIDKKSLSKMAIYVLTPCLIFSFIVQSTVAPGEFGLMILFVLVITTISCAIALLVGRLLQWPSRTIDALVMSVGFLNCGNFGLSVVLFSFGDAGLELATVFFVAASFLANTVAAFFAARGSGSQWKAFLRVLKLPGPYAFVVALAVRSFQVQVPQMLLKPISLIGRASVPVMLMMLGLQLSQTRVGRRYKQVAVGVALRLVIGALAAIGLAPLMGLSGLARQVAIVEASTPTAISSVLMAIEFDADTEYVSSAVFFSTLLSSITLTALLSFLRA